ncbi:MAG: insulinase family protein [Muribaculaceae bacterium]|nr:insulinase family protein [Muribaculaceae bacterium]
MITYNTHILQNGLQLIHHRDSGSRFAVVNVLYNVGARNDPRTHTGLAHLMEHLMFGGTPEAPDFDSILQNAGGHSNAWTSSDITNYYDVIPLLNIDTALWLEADRMQGLLFSEHSLEVQRKVVCEEFKETVLNAPYGDTFHILSKNAFTEHPYRTPVIGDNLHDIETITSSDVKQFFYANYTPSNAIISIVADLPYQDVIEKVEQYFSNIANKDMDVARNNFPQNDKSCNTEIIRVNCDVPENMILMAYHMDKRTGADYPATDMITDLLSTGQSSLFMQNVIQKGDTFRALNASVWGTIDPGLLFIKGFLHNGESFEKGVEIINREVMKIVSGEFSEFELQKAINKAESMSRLENTNQEDLAYNLAYFTMLGDTSLINTEYDAYRTLTTTQVSKCANDIFVNNAPTILFYGKNA